MALCTEDLIPMLVLGIVIPHIGEYRIKTAENPWQRVNRVK